MPRKKIETREDFEDLVSIRVDAAHDALERVGKLSNIQGQTLSEKEIDTISAYLFEKWSKMKEDLSNGDEVVATRKFQLP